jgi:hypothetical protein
LQRMLICLYFSFWVYNWYLSRLAFETINLTQYVLRTCRGCASPWRGRD